MFENVRAINLNYMNYNCPDFVYDFNCWSKLESLSVDFYELSNSNELLKKFLNGSYHANLKSLRILSINLLRSSAFELRKKCINLRRLQLIDVSFKVKCFCCCCFILFFNVKLCLLFSQLIICSTVCCIWNIWMNCT